LFIRNNGKLTTEMVFWKKEVTFRTKDWHDKMYPDKKEENKI